MVYGGKVDNGKFIAKINPVPFNLLDSILDEIGYDPNSTEVIVTIICSITINNITNGAEYISASIIKDSASKLSYKVNNFDNILECEIPEGTTTITGNVKYKIWMFVYAEHIAYTKTLNTKTFINKITTKNNYGIQIVYDPVDVYTNYRPYTGLSLTPLNDGLNKLYYKTGYKTTSPVNVTLFQSNGAPDIGSAVNMNINFSPGQLIATPNNRTINVYYHIFLAGSTSTNVYYDVTFNVHSEETTSNEKRFNSTTNFAGGSFTFNRYSPQTFVTTNNALNSTADTFQINSRGLFYLEIRNPILKRNNSSGTNLYYVGYGFYFGDTIDANMPINEQSLGNGMLTYIPESKNTLHVAILVSETSLSKRSDTSQTLTLNVEGLSSTQISSATATIAAGGYVDGHCFSNATEYTFNLLNSSFSVPVTGYVELLWVKDITIKTKSTKYGYSIEGLEDYCQLNKISNTEFNVENVAGYNGCLKGSRALGRNTKTFTLTFKEYVEETPITEFYITNFTSTNLSNVSISFYSEAKERYYDFSTSVSSNQSKTKIGELKGVHWYESIKVNSLNVTTATNIPSLFISFPGCKTSNDDLNGSNKNFSNNTIGFINVSKNNSKGLIELQLNEIQIEYGPVTLLLDMYFDNVNVYEGTGTSISSTITISNPNNYADGICVIKKPSSNSGDSLDSRYFNLNSPAPYSIGCGNSHTAVGYVSKNYDVSYDCMRLETFTIYSDSYYEFQLTGKIRLTITGSISAKSIVLNFVDIYDRHPSSGGTLIKRFIINKALVFSESVRSCEYDLSKDYNNNPLIIFSGNYDDIDYQYYIVLRFSNILQYIR